MYPNLSYIFHDLFGTQPDNWASVFQTFGLFMALAFLSAALNLFSELRRKQGQGLMLPVKDSITIGKPASPIEMLWNAIIGFVIGFKVLYIFQTKLLFKMQIQNSSEFKSVKLFSKLCQYESCLPSGISRQKIEDKTRFNFQ